MLIDVLSENKLGNVELKISLWQGFGSLWYTKCSVNLPGTLGGGGRGVFLSLFNQAFLKLEYT